MAFFNIKYISVEKIMAFCESIYFIALIQLKKESMRKAQLLTGHSSGGNREFH